MRMRGNEAISGEVGAQDVPAKTGIWHHPGGKLVENGAHSLTQAELLAILLGAGIPGKSALDIANTILDEYVGLYWLHTKGSIKKLAAFSGVGQRKAARIYAAIELGRILYSGKNNGNSKEIKQDENELFFHKSEPDIPEDKKRNGNVDDARLISTIIGSGIKGHSANEIANDLLTRFGSFRDLYDKDMGEFRKIKGLDSVKIIRIAAALEIAKRLAQAIS